MWNISKLISIVIILLSTFIIWKVFISNNKINKRIIYNFGEYKLSCDTEFNNGVKNGKSLCYDSNGILFLEENYINDTLNGVFQRYFSNGDIYRSGFYKNGKRVGPWIEFYKNRKTKVYKYYDSLNYQSIYQKSYDTLDNPNDVVFPIKITPDHDTINLGDTIKFDFALLHSEFDSVILNCYFDLNNDLTTWEDTVISFSPNFKFSLKAVRKGKNLIQGDFHEFDSELNWGGGYPFEIEYYVK